MVSPVLAFADSTQEQAIHGDASESPTVTAYAPIAKPVAAPPAASTNPCAGNTKGQRVVVSIAKQHAWYCASTKVVYSTPVTTGMVTPTTQTPTGHFAIRAKMQNTVLRPNTGEHFHVQYWLAFSGTVYGFHDAAWQKVGYGTAKYRTGGSHGCVHLPLPAAKKLYSWAKIGTGVTIA
jgi:lipoprotein-anchoring transpeptidase ErfK/SrfK